jgi:energy-coupling factor transporter ATP-binding protein EcfA2
MMLEGSIVATSHTMIKPIKFSKATRLKVAGRCAFRCSFPGCDKPTIGPGARSDQTALTGEAAHIFSASPGGPRGQGSLTEDQLRSPENAIWLCSDHATYVDTNRGEKFPPELLLSYKALQEARVAREQGGLNSPAGWFHELAAIESPVFIPNTRIRFGKLTVIAGNNGSGKTAFCEWLAGLGGPSELQRWDHPRDEHCNVKLQVTYFDPMERHARIEISKNDVINYYLEDREVPFYPFRLGLIRLPQYFIRDFKDDERDELQLVSDILNVPTSTVRNLIPYANRHNHGYVKNLRLVERPNGCALLADHEGENIVRCFRKTSDSQRAKTLIELCVAMARVSSEFLPTILMIEGGILSLNSFNFAKYAEYLLSAEHHFQTILMLIKAPSIDILKWSGWEFARLIGTNTKVVIDQSPF